eukprot:1357038-Rhodomonas_salina.2
MQAALNSAEGQLLKFLNESSLLWALTIACTHPRENQKCKRRNQGICISGPSAPSAVDGQPQSIATPGLLTYFPELGSDVDLRWHLVGTI